MSKPNCQAKPLDAGEMEFQQNAPVVGFLDFKQLCQRVPLSERTLREAIKRRQIPHIRLPGARRLLFDWETVRVALLRHQRGGP